MKLMLVGSANAGKTTLLQQLTRKGKMALRRAVQIGINGRPLSTVGVDLGEWEFSPDMSSPKVTFMTWDFGGQVHSSTLYFKESDTIICCYRLLSTGHDFSKTHAIRIIFHTACPQ